jgi:hypothetical protein
MSICDLCKEQKEECQQIVLSSFMSKDNLFDTGFENDGSFAIEELLVQCINAYSAMYVN